MPDTPPPTPAPADDPFDLGDTNTDPGAVAPIPEPAVPRNPDGTFAPRNPDPTPAPTQPPHPAYLTEAAQSFGIPDDEIAALSTDRLNAQVWRLQKQREALRNEFATQRTVQEGQVRTPAVQTPAPAPAPQEEDFDFGVDLSEFDPRLVAALKKAALTPSKQVKELQAQLASERAEREQRETRSNIDLLDAAFAKLGPKYEKLLGKGPGREMKVEHEAEYKRRLAVLTAAQIDIKNVNRATIIKQLRDAADMLFGAAPDGTYGEVVQPAPRITQQQWDEGALARPTNQRGSPEPNGDAKAVANLTSRMREAGMLEPDSEVLDGLLD